MRDLEIRGAGSILGEMQHGHMDEVGYDMYCRLLDEVVKEMKGIEVIEEQDVQIDINISSYIPEEFAQDSNQKIEIYQNIALCRREEDIRNVIDEIIDRYGKLPSEIENLTQVARIKNKAREIGVTKITEKNKGIVFHFGSEYFKMEWIDILVNKYKNRIKFSPAKEPYITYTLKNEENKLKEVQEFLDCCIL